MVIFQIEFYFFPYSNINNLRIFYLFPRATSTLSEFSSWSEKTRTSKNQMTHFASSTHYNKHLSVSFCLDKETKPPRSEYVITYSLISETQWRVHFDKILVCEKSPCRSMYFFILWEEVSPPPTQVNILLHSLGEESSHCSGVQVCTTFLSSSSEVRLWPWPASLTGPRKGWSHEVWSGLLGGDEENVHTACTLPRPSGLLHGDVHCLNHWDMNCLHHWDCCMRMCTALIQLH